MRLTNRVENFLWRRKGFVLHKAGAGASLRGLQHRHIGRTRVCLGRIPLFCVELHAKSHAVSRCCEDKRSEEELDNVRTGCRVSKTD